MMQRALPQMYVHRFFVVDFYYTELSTTVRALQNSPFPSHISFFLLIFFLRLSVTKRVCTTTTVYSSTIIQRFIENKRKYVFKKVYVIIHVKQIISSRKQDRLQKSLFLLSFLHLNHKTN